MNNRSDVKKNTKRKSIDTATDPYLSKVEYEDKSVCRKCEAVYINKRWSVKEEHRQAAEGGPKALCPACRKIKENYPSGYVTLKGAFLKDHKEEIVNLLKNKEERAMHINPLERIIDLDDKGDTLEVTTTTEKFAQRIGQMMKKTYKGEVEYKWSDDVKIARVTWSRDE